MRAWTLSPEAWRALFPGWDRVSTFRTLVDDGLIVKLEIDDVRQLEAFIGRHGASAAARLLASHPESLARLLEHKRQGRKFAFRRRRRCCS